MKELITLYLIRSKYKSIIRRFNKMKDIDIKEINLYDIFLKYSYSDLKEMFKVSKSKEEKDFYMTLANMVLQKEQAKVIGK